MGNATALNVKDEPNGEFLYACSQDSEEELLLKLEFIKENRSDELKTLLEFKETNLKQTPLQILIHKGFLNVIKKMFEYLPDLNHMISDVSAIHYSIISSQPDILSYFLTLDWAKDHISAFEGQDNETPLHIAAKEGEVVCASLLFDLGKIDPKEISSIGCTISGAQPIFIAAQKGHLNIINLFISKQPNLNSRWRSGATPLMVAAQNGHGDIVNVLIKAGADIDIQRLDGSTALICAAYQGHLDIVNQLIGAGASFDKKTKQGFTAFAWAVYGNKEAIACVLMGADPNWRSMDLPPTPEFEIWRNIRANTIPSSSS